MRTLVPLRACRCFRERGDRPAIQPDFSGGRGLPAGRAHVLMVGATSSSVSGRELACLGRVTRPPPMLEASKAAWARGADGLAGRPPGRQVGPGAAQTRQIAPRAREIVASTIYAVSTLITFVEPGMLTAVPAVITTRSP